MIDKGVDEAGEKQRTKDQDLGPSQHGGHSLKSYRRSPGKIMGLMVQTPTIGTLFQAIAKAQT